MDRKELVRLIEECRYNESLFQKQLDLMDELVLSNVSGTLDDKSRRDFKEDFKHENGNYINKCGKCKNSFYGHKRRVRCKLCSF